MEDKKKNFTEEEAKNIPSNFIHEFINEDLAEGGDYEGQTVHTRFPPEPNGYLHIGHAKAIWINFSTAAKYGGLTNLRMDDTNPAREEQHYVEKIKEDVAWLGFDWEDRFYYASDYFGQMYEYALELIEKGLAYVCDLSAEEIRETRGTLTEPGTNSPYRDRSAEESLDLFKRMRAGEFEDGTRTLRAKIDMTSGNMNMRDPVLYRISHQAHHRTGTEWPIYPMYDYAHPLEDAIEGITHSLCSIEFENHRPLYNWVRDKTSVKGNPRQIEFARLGMNYTVMSKRKLRSLVEENLVDGWDYPRMPTLSGLRRRGYTPTAIRDFCERTGVSKAPNTVDMALLEACLRDDLGPKAPRAMAVLDPVELVITNYPEGETEIFNSDYLPDNPEAGSREVPFSSKLWIEREDFMEEPPRKYHRLYPGNEVRLKDAYIVKCTGFEKDDDGKVTRVLATYDPESRGGSAPDGRRIRGTIHWTDQATAIDAEVRLYDRLFTVEDPDTADDYHSVLNPESLEILEHCKLEPALAEAKHDTPYQFMRKGYFSLDSHAEEEGRFVFNRSVTLRDSFKLKK